jgi:hypothetical protein
VLSFPVACFLVLVAFLGCLGLFALAVTKVVAPDGRGHARGVGGGCAAALALLLLLGLGTAGLAATVGAIALGSVAEWNPIRRIEIERAPGARSADPSRREDEERSSRESAVSARVTVRDDAGAVWSQLLDDLVDVDLSELGDDMKVHRHASADGGEFSVYEFRLPVSEKDLERFERDLGRELDGFELRLPERVDVEFEGPR